ncbi:MAG: HPP family protein [Kofleriaceae bacterium]
MNRSIEAVPISEAMSTDPITARADASIASLVSLMTEYHISCVPIVDEDRRPTGIVTKLDLIECANDGRTSAREVMMPHAMTLRSDASLKSAAELMTREGFHHVLVVDDHRTLVGVVSTFDITRWVAQQT